MNGLNDLAIIGNVTKNAELVMVPVNGQPTPRCTFSVAVNETRSNGQEIVTYFDVTAWRDYATKIAPWVIKGRQVHVKGSVRLHTYTANNGTRSSMQIHNPTVTLLGKKPEADAVSVDEFDEDELPFG